MATVVFGNTKGGSGKTTMALILAGQFIAAGGRVVFVEGDPNKPLARWASNRGSPVIAAKTVPVQSWKDATNLIEQAAGKSRFVVVTTEDQDEDLMDWLAGASAWAHFVIVDPEGSPNQWMTAATTQADLVLIPFAPTTLDATQVGRTVKQIRQISRMAGKSIPHRVVLTRTNPVPTRSERAIRKHIEADGLPMLSTFLMDRPAYRDLFTYDALLSELTPEQVNGLEKAHLNAAQLMNEIVSLLDAQTSVEVAA